MINLHPGHPRAQRSPHSPPSRKKEGPGSTPGADAPAVACRPYIFPSVSSARRTCASVKLDDLGYFWMISRYAPAASATLPPAA